ncbi:M9 family metallopeptidase [Vibrio ostreicida]|uniref:M9 family metallopeptidase n=1 Tax=Vibrio ostreicida TaxID=526588 RepID=UPI0009707CBE|nr:M9 family metallopeptidase [Vibrio ostreicida]
MKYSKPLGIAKTLASSLLLAGTSFNAFSASECEFDALTQSSDWLPKITQAESSCYHSWFNAPKTAALTLYSEASIQQVQMELSKQVRGYQGRAEHAKLIANLSEFVKAAYFSRYATQSDYGYYSERLSRALAGSSVSFLNLPYVESTDADQVQAMSAMTLMLDSVKQLPVAIGPMLDLLESFDRNNSENLQYVDGLNNLFRAMSGHIVREEFYAEFIAHPEYLQRLENFVNDNRWALGSDAEFLIYNAVRESGRLLVSRDDSLRQRVLSFMERVLERNAIGSEGEILWVAAAEMILHYAPERGAELGLKQSKLVLEQRLLPNRYLCQGPAIIRSQNLSQRQSQQACEVLANTETEFHEVVNSGGTSVKDDFNHKVEVVVWQDNQDYVSYSNFLFGNSTDNGGQYLEGDPSKVGNIARFIAYRFESGEALSILNLEHEYVHYLDGRFNLYGGFNETLSRGNIVWWLEGFAEYMHYRSGYVAAVNLSCKTPLTLAEVFATTYEHDLDRIYRWGYLGVRFMFEEHPQEMDRLLQLARSGDYERWSDEVSRLGIELKSSFELWLATLPCGQTDNDDSHGGNGDGGKEPDNSQDIRQFGLNDSQPFSANQYDESLFYIDVGNDVTQLTVKIQGDGDADLYASHQKVAHYYDYQVSNFQRGSDEEIVFSPQENGLIAPGRYYFSLSAREAFSNVIVTSSAQTRSPSKGQDDLTPILMDIDQALTLDVNATRYVGLYIKEPTTVRFWMSAKGSRGSDIDLFVGTQSWATEDDFDVSSQRSGSDEYFELPVDEAGYIYVTLKANQQGGQVELYAID